MQTTQIFWILFFVFISGAVFFDLFWLGKRKGSLSLKKAGLWTAGWIFLAFLFNFSIYIFLDHQKALEFSTAYLLEYSLSLDNLFVFLVIFSYFDLALPLQYKVLKWGILGAFLMRMIFIFLGIFLLQKFHFLFYIFGAFLIYSGIKLFFQKTEKVAPERNLFLRIIRKIVPLVDDMKEGKFCVKIAGKFCLTPLFIILVLVESADLVFAIDSVPAVLAITRDPFIAYTSNAFAILGLRALYFFLVGFLPKFIYLKRGITALLIFIGLKMILSDSYPIPLAFSMGIIILILGLAIIFSLFKQRQIKNHVITH